MRNFKSKALRATVAAAILVIASLGFTVSCKASALQETHEVTLNAGGVKEPGTMKVYYQDGKWYEDASCTVNIDKISIPVWKYRVVKVTEKNDGTYKEDDYAITSNGQEKGGSTAGTTDASRTFSGYGDIIREDGTFTKKAPTASTYDAIWKEDSYVGKLSVPTMETGRVFSSYEVVKKLGENKYESTGIIRQEMGSDNLIQVTLTDEVTYLLVHSVSSEATTVMFKAYEGAPTGNIAYYIHQDATWRETENLNSKIKNKIEYPPRTQTIIFSTFGGTLPNVDGNKTEYLTWAFAGYKKGDVAYTDENGYLQRLEAAQIEADKESGNQVTVVATYNAPKAINFNQKDTNGDYIYIPTRDGYNFDGWKRTKADGTVEVYANPNDQAAPKLFEQEDWEEGSSQTITFYAQWVASNAKVLTLDPNGATSGVDVRRILSRGNSWFVQDGETDKQITRISVPKKEWTINFNANWQGATIAKKSDIYSQKFAGYKLDGITSNTVIDSSGNITASALTEASHAVAEWIEESYYMDNTISWPEEGKGVEFLGWSETGKVFTEGEVIPTGFNLYLNGKTGFTPTKDNVTLYGVWRDSRKYKLELKKENVGGDIGSDVSEIWYSYGKKQWYKDQNLSTPLKVEGKEGGVTIAKPKRVWTITYTPSLENIRMRDNKTSETYEFVFKEYGEYVNENGEIKGDVSLSKDMIVMPTFDRPKYTINTEDPKYTTDGAITLPTLENGGMYVEAGGNVNNEIAFVGWKKSKSGTEVLPSEFIPDNSDISLYGAWTNNTTYVVNLGAKDESKDTTVNWSGATRQIYYSIADGSWYTKYEYDNDTNAWVKTLYKSADFKAPTRTVKVTLEGIETNDVITDKKQWSDENITSGYTVSYPFSGYSGYIDKSGQIVTGATVTKEENNKWVDASWQSPTEMRIELPILKDRENSTFIGWREKVSAKDDAPSDIVNEYVVKSSETRGEVAFESVWQDNTVYPVYLKAEGATSVRQNTLYVRARDHQILESDKVITSLPTTLLPKKVYSLEFNRNGINELASISLEPKSVEWRFMGYKDAETGTLYIDANGAIDPAIKAITKETNLVAVWDEDSDAVRVDIPEIRGYIINGWKKSLDGEVIKENAWTFKDTATESDVKNGKITLYLDWAYEKVYKLILASTATTDEQNDSNYSKLTQEIYYRVNDGWYGVREEVGTDTDGNPIYTVKGSELTKVSPLPRRERMITLEPGKNIETDINTTIYVPSEFKGYGSRSGSIAPNIKEDGTIQDGYVISSDTEILAIWGDYKPVALPSLTSAEKDDKGNPLYLFLGWSTKEDPNTLISGEYTTTKKDITLYARWKDQADIVVTLNHNKGKKGENGKDVLYKNPSNGVWYTDEQKQNMVSDGIVAERSVKVNFVTNHPTDESFKELAEEYLTWKFKGYMIGATLFINEKGEIENDNVTKSTTAVAMYDDTVDGIDLNKKALTAEGFTFIGWRLSGQDTVLPNIFAPAWDDKYGYVDENNKGEEITLEGVWSSEKYLTIELDADNGTTKETILYREKTNGYHATINDESTISAIRKPEKSWEVRYDVNLEGAESVNTAKVIFTFAGYYGAQDNVQYVQSNGEFTTSRPTDENGTKWKAKWTNGLSNTITVPSTNRKGYNFLGWSFEKGETDESKRYKEGSTIDISSIDPKYIVNNKITLYGNWEENAIRIIKIADPTATSKGYEELYYRVGDGWYKDAEKDADGNIISLKNSITKIIIPQRIWYISFESNLLGVDNPTQIASESTFGGIYPVKDGTSDPDTSVAAIVNGGTTEAKLPSNYITNVPEGEPKQKEIYAAVYWRDNDPITLPALTKENYRFIGWTPKVGGIEDSDNINQEDKANITSGGAAFIPEYEKYYPTYQVGAGTGNVKLYGVWYDERIFKLTLEGNGSTSLSHTTEIYYKPQTKKWYGNANGEGNAISYVRIPEKKWLINYNTTWTTDPTYGIPEDERVLGVEATLNGSLEWSFAGYEALVTEQYVDDGGTKHLELYAVPALGITTDRTVKAIWDTVRVTDGNGNAEDLNNGSSLSTDRWSFDGWTETPSQSAPLVANPYRPFDGDTKTIYDLAYADPDNPDNHMRPFVQENAVNQTKYITLYARWRDIGLKGITLNSNGATKALQNKLYYATGEDKWYLTADKQSDVDRIALPEKIWTFEFDSGDAADEGVRSEDPIALRSTFKGYTLKNKQDPSQAPFLVVDKDGMINANEDKATLINYLRKDTSIDETAIAEWDIPESIKMPDNITRPGYKLIGWGLTPNSLDADIFKAGTTYYFDPSVALVQKLIEKLEASENGKITLYAQWERNHINTLNLDSTGATSKSNVTAMYYWVGKGWYNIDPDPAVNPNAQLIKVGQYAVTAPTCDITIKYDLNSATGATPSIPLNHKESEGVKRRFLGYSDTTVSPKRDYISDVGNLLATSWYEADKREATATAQWGNADTVLLTSGYTLTDYEFLGWSFYRDGSYQVEGGGTVKEIFTDKFTLGERASDWSKVVTAADGTKTVTLYAVWSSTRIYRVKLSTTGYENKTDNSALSTTALVTSDMNITLYYKEADEKWYTDPTISDAYFTVMQVPSSRYSVYFATGSYTIKPPEPIYSVAPYMEFRYFSQSPTSDPKQQVVESWIDDKGVFKADVATKRMKALIAGEGGGEKLTPSKVTYIYPIFKSREKVAIPAPIDGITFESQMIFQEGFLDADAGKPKEYYFYGWKADGNASTWKDMAEIDSNTANYETLATKGLYPVASTLSDDAKITLTSKQLTLNPVIEDTTSIKMTLDINRGFIEKGDSDKTDLELIGTTKQLNATINSDGTYTGDYIKTFSYRLSTGKWYVGEVPNTEPGRGLIKNTKNKYTEASLSDHPGLINRYGGSETAQKPGNSQLPSRVDLIEFETNFKLAMDHNNQTEATMTITNRDGTTSSHTVYATSASDDYYTKVNSQLLTRKFEGYKTIINNVEYEVFDENMDFTFLDQNGSIYTPRKGDAPIVIKASWGMGDDRFRLPSSPQLHITTTPPYDQIVESTTPITGHLAENYSDQVLTQDQLSDVLNRDNYSGPIGISFDSWSSEGWTATNNSSQVGYDDDSSPTVSSASYMPSDDSFGSTVVAYGGKYYFNTKLYGKWILQREYIFLLDANKEGERGAYDGFNLKFEDGEAPLASRAPFDDAYNHKDVVTKGLPIIRYSTTSGWSWDIYDPVEQVFDDKLMVMDRIATTEDPKKTLIHNTDMVMPYPESSKYVVTLKSQHDSSYTGTLEAETKFLGYYLSKSLFDGDNAPWITNKADTSSVFYEGLVAEADEKGYPVQDKDNYYNIVDGDGDYLLMDMGGSISLNGATWVNSLRLRNPILKLDNTWDNVKNKTTYNYRYEVYNDQGGKDPIENVTLTGVIPAKAKWIANADVTLPKLADVDGLTHVGWSLKENDVKPADGQPVAGGYVGDVGTTYKPKKSETLYAVWVENYKLAVSDYKDSSGGSLGTNYILAIKDVPTTVECTITLLNSATNGTPTLAKFKGINTDNDLFDLWVIDKTNLRPDSTLIVTSVSDTQLGVKFTGTFTTATTNTTLNTNFMSYPKNAQAYIENAGIQTNKSWIMYKVLTLDKAVEKVDPRLTSYSNRMVLPIVNGKLDTTQTMPTVTFTLKNGYGLQFDTTKITSPYTINGCVYEITKSANSITLTLKGPVDSFSSGTDYDLNIKIPATWIQGYSDTTTYLEQTVYVKALTLAGTTTNNNVANVSGTTVNGNKSAISDPDVLYTFGGPGTGVTNIATNAFKGTASSRTPIKYVKIGEGVRKINDAAFMYTQLEYIELPKTLTEIGGSAFNNTRNLKSITLYPGLIKIGSYQFEGSGIETINFMGTYAQWSAIDKTDWKSGNSNTIRLVCTDASYDVTGRGNGTYTRV